MMNNATSDSDPSDSAFWKILNLFPFHFIVSRSFPMYDRSSGDLNLRYVGIKTFNFSEVSKIYKMFSGRLVSEDKFTAASKLYDQLSSLQCSSFEYRNIVSVANLTKSFTDIPFGDILGPYNDPNVQVQISSSTLHCINEINQLVKNYDIDEIKTFFNILGLYHLDFYISDSLSAYLHSSSVAVQIFPQELQEYLYNEDINIEARKMYHYIKSALLDAIQQSTWMDEPTRQSATKKALRLAEFVQMPDLNLPKFKIDQCTPYKFYYEFFKQQTLVSKFFHEYPLQRLHRLQWPNIFALYGGGLFGGYSSTNAAYFPNSNIFVLLYGILGTPFFETNRPSAMNFGSIGLISSHETSQ
jgi:hypothetical protein